MINDNYNQIRYVEWGMSDPKAVVILVHGLGASVERWGALGEVLRRKSISSYAIELNNDPDYNKLCVKTGYFKRYYADILRLRELVVKNNPQKKVFLLGESLGGLISYLIACEHKTFFSGLILIAPAFANKVKFSIINYIKMALALIFYRSKYFKMPFDSTMCTRDTDFIERLKKDKREHRSATALLFAEILNSQLKTLNPQNQPDIPTLFLTAGDDKLVYSEKAREVYIKMILEDKEFIEYPHMYHSLSIDIGKEQVFEDIVNWIEKRAIN